MSWATATTVTYDRELAAIGKPPDDLPLPWDRNIICQI
jgi:hypothetical protein